MSFATSSFASAAFADLGSSSIIVSLSGVSSETDLGTLSVGVGDIVQVTGLQFGSSTGTITLGQGDQEFFYKIQFYLTQPSQELLFLPKEV